MKLLMLTVVLFQMLLLPTVKYHVLYPVPVYVYCSVFRLRQYIMLLFYHNRNFVVPVL